MFNRHLLLLIVPSLLSGCWMLPLPKTSDRSIDSNKLTSLIGAADTVVIGEIGPPMHRLTGPEAKYFVYKGYIDSIGVGFMFFFPFGFETLAKDTLDCLRLEFRNGIFTSYVFKTRSMTYHRGVPRRETDCRDLFWSRDQLRILVPEDTRPSVSPEQRRARAEAGDAEAQFQLYYRDAASAATRVVWLCRSADQGHTYAQAEVGRIYNMGLLGVPKDLRRGYIWYSLAVKANPQGWQQEYLQIKSRLPPEQLQAAEAMLSDWKPGQCERHLVPALGN